MECVPTTSRCYTGGALCGSCSPSKWYQSATVNSRYRPTSSSIQLRNSAALLDLKTRTVTTLITIAALRLQSLIRQ